MRKPLAAAVATNAIPYISRLKFFGLPFHAAYAMAAAIDGTTTKKVNKSNPASIHKPAFESIVVEA
jgi:hypothetical protein